MDRFDAAQVRAVLEFWLGPDLETSAGLNLAVARWFARNADVDAEIGAHFGVLIARAASGDLDAWAQTPRAWLALLILLDQFPRNVFRDDARAFAGDTKGQALALAGITRGDDRALHPVERMFAYLPFEHAEDLAQQDRSVALFRALRTDAPTPLLAMFDGFVDYALRHREVIARFGRFPHRNAVLGRRSSTEEVAYLAQPGAGF